MAQETYRVTGVMAAEDWEHETGKEIAPRVWGEVLWMEKQNHFILNGLQDSVWIIH